MAEETNYIYCFMIYIIGHLFGLSALFWVGMWIDYDKSGFGFHERADLEFKFHPICMALSLVFLNGEAVMIYRGLRFWPKFVTKAIHAVLHTVCFVFMVLGLKAAWDYHDYHRTNGVITPTPNALYPHSWVGLATASLYGVQFAGGIVAFYIPSTPMHVRAAFMPVHRSAGLLIFAFSLGAALMGTGEKAAFLQISSGFLSCPQIDNVKETVVNVNQFDHDVFFQITEQLDLDPSDVVKPTSVLFNLKVLANPKNTRSLDDRKSGKETERAVKSKPRPLGQASTRKRSSDTKQTKLSPVNRQKNKTPQNETPPKNQTPLEQKVPSETDLSIVPKNETDRITTPSTTPITTTTSSTTPRSLSNLSSPRSDNQNPKETKNLSRRKVRKPE
ncbi:putative cytochrome b561 [Aphelenchoides besseyi]|nr:putative cytochrome b561 [Aphelenchoides besseyi]